MCQETSLNQQHSIQYKKILSEITTSLWVNHIKVGLHDISNNYRYRHNSICDISISQSDQSNRAFMIFIPTSPILGRGVENKNKYYCTLNLKFSYVIFARKKTNSTSIVLMNCLRNFCSSLKKFLIWLIFFYVFRIRNLRFEVFWQFRTAVQAKVKIQNALGETNIIKYKCSVVYCMLVCWCFGVFCIVSRVHT